MKTLFLAWQDSITRAWFPIGKLTYDGQRYCFGYIQGALQAQEKANFRPLMAFPDFHQSYTSIELFWPFANRLLNKSRPEYPEFIEWLNPDPNGSSASIDPITLLGLSGGKRVTDSLEVFPMPEHNASGEYQIHFFANGLRHYPTSAQQRAAECVVGEELMLVHDLQNEYDSDALMLRTVDRYIVGFCPRYLIGDFIQLIGKQPAAVKVVVEKVNLAPTPLQFRLMCKLTAQGQQSFQPFSGDEYKLLIPIEALLAEAY
jgi:hypothetical protein